MSMRYQKGGFISAFYNPLEVPDAPTIGTATAGQFGNATITFTAPAVSGGSAITSYTVLSSGGQVATGASSPIVVSGLDNGASYTFRVFANNSFGPSASSASSNSITAVVAQQVAYTTAGTYSWVAPAGITSGTVSAVCVGGGGGLYGTAGDSYFINTSTVAGFRGLSGTGSALSGGGYVGDGGGNGGDTTGTGFLTGAGAGGYTGKGGNGVGYGQSTGNAGSGGGGGTGGAGSNSPGISGGGGGGVGLLGQGTSGSASGVGAGGGGGSGGANGTNASFTGGFSSPPGNGGAYGGGGGGGYGLGYGGSGGGLGWKNGIPVTAGASYTVVVGAGANSGGSGGDGGSGAVRIIWSTSGVTRAFPTTNTGDL